VFWNIAARQEYYNKTITRLCGGNRRLGCYSLAVVIFSIGIIRDFLYNQALKHQPSSAMLLPLKLLGGGLFLSGNVLVLTSLYQLGITGTYLGDYFGILMSKRVTAFPFSITANPMYNGSCMSFLGTAIWYGKPAGIVLSALVYLMYRIACQYEEPFTAEIYSKKN